MSGITFTKKQRTRMVDALEQDFETADDAAAAVLALAMELYAERAKFTVVGQIHDRTTGERGDKIALGGYATAHQATEDALKLAYSTRTHEEHLAYVLPIHHGTPSSYYDKRAAERKAAAIQDGSLREQELARRTAWLADNPGKQPPTDWGFVPFDNELEDCWACNGLGKIKKEDEAA